MNKVFSLTIDVFYFTFGNQLEKVDLEFLFFFIVLIMLLISFVFNCRYRMFIKKIKGVNLDLRASIILKDGRLKVKKLLLSELHHRVKNNFQIVVSFLNIEARGNDKINLIDFINKIESRIAVIAAIHQTLDYNYDSGMISVEHYFRNIMDNILEINNLDYVAVIVDIEQIKIDSKICISLGLIVNELVCNSIKYSFPNSYLNAEIVIRLKRIDDFQYVLFYGDNGVGRIDGYQSKKSLGLDIVGMLVSQIGGIMESNNKPHLSYSINFSV